jgi:hypothetical protein
MATESDRPKSPRPDGTDLSRYRGWERWTPRHWAWEFLRRNPRFQAACRRVAEADEASRQQVATEYGLRQFKHYAEAYAGGERPRPTFVAATPAIWSLMDDDAAAARVRRIRLQPGQVLVRFDLAAASPHALALDAQLRRATTRLDAKLQELRSRLNQVPSRRAPKSTVFIKCLRYLDLVASGRLPGDALMTITERKYINESEVRDTVKQASGFLNDYVVIALMKTAQKGSVRAR